MRITGAAHRSDRGMSLLELTVSTTVFMSVMGGFLTAVKMYSDGINYHCAVFRQVQDTEQMLDDMIIGLRWVAAQDPSLSFTFPAGANKNMPMITFRRIKGVNSGGDYIWGDKLSYYWLPSERENPKYAPGNAGDYDSDDIDGVDHDNNGVRNDGVIWRRITDLAAEGADGDGVIGDLGYDTFTGKTVDQRIVFTNVPPPFQVVGGVVVPLDSFRVEVDSVLRTVTLTIKRFIDTKGQTVRADMDTHPSGVPLTDSAITIPTMTVLTVRRVYCVRN